MMANHEEDGRDRLIAVLASDFTKTALEYGDSAAGMFCLSFSSATLARAAAGARAMGMTGGLLLPGGDPIDEDLARVAGMAAYSLQKRKDFPFRFVSLCGRKVGGSQHAIVACQGDFKRTKPDMEVLLGQTLRILDMIGVDNSMPSRILWRKGPNGALAKPELIRDWASWVENAYAERGDFWL